MYIYSNTAANTVIAELEKKIGAYEFKDAAGSKVDCPLLKCEQAGAVYRCTFDATALKLWSPDTPVLYTFTANGESVRFGHSSIRPFQNKEFILNGSPVFLRGYIRGIIAHDHPNMTGGTLYDAAVKNIKQAKKYGFNLVRFHSTIPTEDFVNAADELGLLIHIEIGFAYDYDENGNKKNLSMNNAAWHDTIVKYRNHPSIAVFCIGNEMHNSGHFQEVHKMYEEGRALAPNKLIMDNSGWGEYDRSTADIYSQHIAYFFPYKHHEKMFLQDNPWRMNGSVYDEPLEGEIEQPKSYTAARRFCTPIRPVLSHEAVHYIDVPDYEALSKKFDEFAAKVGDAYLKEYGIKKPRFMTELPALIKRKGLEARIPDFIAGSQQFKLMALKTFIERLRFSQLRGFEMLQFSDCMKYENKNGIVDCFDDDKYIPADWMRTFNDDLALLADSDNEVYYYGDTIKVRIAVSDFLPQPEITGDLKVTFGDELIYSGRKFVLAGGLQTLVDLSITTKLEEKAAMRTLAVEYVSDGKRYVNSWNYWLYPKSVIASKPEFALSEDHAWIADAAKNAIKSSNVFVTDKFDEDVFAKLAAGKDVVLLYEYGAKRNKWQMQGALERFKPCIWDRGSNLGGIIDSAELQAALAANRYFDKNMQPLLEAGTKVNLDHCPFKVSQFISGIDKPVRDRMKGLIQNIKEYLDDDMLRNFSHLFSVKVGAGTLVVCTFNFDESLKDNPVTNAMLKVLLDDGAIFKTDKSVEADAFIAWLDETNAKGFQKEDVMNHFWEIDNKPVEDTLFWEQAGIDLSTLKES